MIKKLFFMAALLAPCVTHGANRSADLSVQIVPRHLTPAVPAAAKAAGLTTLVLFSDFSQPKYRNLANWMDCIGANTNTEWHQGYGFTRTSVPCNFPQVTDPIYKNTVIDVYYDPNYPTAINWPGQVMSITAQDNTNGITLPNAFYVEVEARSEPAIANSLQAYWTGPVRCCDQKNGWYENDMIEQAVFSNGTDTAYYTINQWITGHDNCGHGGRWCDQKHVSYPGINYIRRGMLLTFDGSILGQCNYENDVETPNLGCLQTTFPASSAEAAQRNVFLISNVPLSSTHQPASIIHLYIKSVKIWSCRNWKTRQCITKLRGSGS